MNTETDSRLGKALFLIGFGLCSASLAVLLYAGAAGTESSPFTGLTTGLVLLGLALAVDFAEWRLRKRRQRLADAQAPAS